MAKFKKAAALFSALLMCGSLFATVACNKGGNGNSGDNSSSESSSSEYVPEYEPSVFALEEHTWTAWETVTAKTCTTDGEEKLVCTDEGCGKVKTRTVKAGHVWSEWTGSTNNLCVEDAQLSRICADCTTVETQTIKTRGHAYNNDGVCKTCEEPFVFPTLSSNPSYVDVWGGNIRGDGGAFSRKALSTDTYYTMDVPVTDPESEDGGVWISVSVSGPGQYALLTIGGTNGVTINRYDASDYYIPGNENGYIGFSAIEGDNDEAYSIVSCSEMHWSNSWRATWRFSTETAATVKFVVIKVAPPEWLPEYIHETVLPKQIKNVTADEPLDGYTAVPVDYNDDYYFDEWNEVYRRGSKSNPGEVLYVAITSAAERLFGDKTFITIQDDGNNLSLFLGTDERGNYLIRDYHSFLLAEESAKAYQNFVNSEGTYPVTQELYEFLRLYTDKNRPFDIPESIWGNETERAQKAWLAPCYCYRQLTPGSQENPFVITELGDFEASPAKFDIVYFTVKYPSETGEPTYLTLSCEDTNARISINGTTYVGPFSVEIEVDAIKGLTFFVGAKNGAATTFTLTLSLTADSGAEN